MRVVDFGPEHGTPVTEFASRFTSAQLLADGSGEGHVYVVHIDAGGEIGPHPAGFGQLFIVIRGSGWVAAADGVRRSVGVGQAAVIARGEVHSKGSVSGMSAVMIQIAQLTPANVDKGAR